MEPEDNNMKSQDYQHARDEIDIGQIFQKIWLRKSFVIGFVSIVILTVLGGFSIKFLTKPPIKEYSRVLTLNFSGASEGLYPSGHRFSASNILAAKVLSEVHKVNNLASLNIGESAFLESFSVSPYATNIAFIDKKFSTLLANKKLSRPEIEGLEKEFLLQLNTARSKFIKISFVDSSFFGLDAVLINKILTDIPKVWSKLSINELGVLNLKNSGGDSYEAGINKRFEYTQMLNYLIKGSTDLESALTVLIEDKVGGSILDTETGFSALDLHQKLENLIRFDIQPLFSTITNLGIVKSKFKTQLYFKNSIQDLSDQKLVLQEKQKNYQIILNTYEKGLSNANSINKNGDRAKSTGFTQFDGTFFDQITSLIEDKSDTKYKQKLLDKRLNIMQEAEVVNGKLVKLERALKQLNSKQQNVSEALKQEFINDIGIVNQQLIDLFKEYRTLLALRNERILGDGSALYGIADSNMSVKSGLKPFLKQTVLFSISSGILALMFAVFMVLLMKSPRKNEQKVA